MEYEAGSSRVTLEELLPPQFSTCPLPPPRLRSHLESQPAEIVPSFLSLDCELQGYYALSFY